MFDGEPADVLQPSLSANVRHVGERPSPGMTLGELLEKRHAQGTWSRDPGSISTSCAPRWRRARTVTFTVEGPGGRAISIYNRPMPDGQWVSCHEDITERRQAEEQTREQKRRLDAALNNMSQGLCMFDAEGQIVLFNPRYAEMLTVSPELVTGCQLARLIQHRSDVADCWGCRSGAVLPQDDELEYPPRQGPRPGRSRPSSGAWSRRSISRCRAAAGSPPTRTSPSGVSRRGPGSRPEAPDGCGAGATSAQGLLDVRRSRRG